MGRHFFGWLTVKNEFRRLPRIKGHGIRRVIVSITFSASLIVTLSGSASAADLPLSPAPASRAVAVSAPALETPSDMRVHAGVPADQTIHATDVDGDPLTFSVNSGPSYMTVTTTDPGSGFATGNIHLAPSLLDAGATTGIVAVYDGLNYRIASFGIAIFPTLERVADMTVDEGSTADQTLTASDSEGYTLSFTLVDGPPFASVTATSDSTGNLHLAPGYADGGHYTSTLSVSDGVSTRSDVFHITVNNQNFPPILTQPEDMHASAGAFSEQLLMASDPDLQPVAFSAVSGHYLSVGTLSPYPGLGFVTITPPPGVTETVQATVAATDGLSSSQKSFEVRIDTENQPPVVHSSPIQIAEGTDPDLQIVATDTDGQRIFATFSNLPLFMTTGTPVQARGGDTLTIPFRLLPKHQDAGVYHPILRVTDLSSTTIDTLTITITEAGFAETSLRLKWSTSGSPIEHEYSTLDGTFAATADQFTFQSTTGSGATATRTYPAGGTYTVTLIVTDNGGATGTQTQSVTVVVPPNLHVGDLDRASTNQATRWTAIVTIRVHDGVHGVVANAAVSGRWNTGSTGSCTTNASGQCKVSRSGILKTKTSVSFAVTNVARAALVYKPADNHDADADSNGTSINVSKP